MKERSSDDIIGSLWGLSGNIECWESFCLRRHGLEFWWSLGARMQDVRAATGLVFKIGTRL
jgi:hypothetical protein